MVSSFREVLGFFDKIGIFDVVLPFLLVFTIVFALLERTKVFGVDKISGVDYTKKNLNSVAAFVISFLVVASSELVEVITEVSSKFVILLFLIVLFLLLVGSFFKEEPHGVFLEGGWKTLFMVIVFLGLVFIFLDALGLLDQTFNLFETNAGGEILGAGLLLIIIVIFMFFVTRERQPEKKS